MHIQLNAELRFGASEKPVRVPVGISGTVSESKEVSFTQVHDCGNALENGAKAEKKAPTAIKQSKRCPVCEVEVEVTVHGVEYVKGKFVTFSDEELRAVKQEKSPVIQLNKFVPRNSVTCLMVSASHYLVPNALVQNGYATLYQALAKAKMAGFGYHSLWGKERPCVVVADNGVLLLQSLHLQEDMVEPDFSAPIPNKEHLKVAQAIVAAGTGELIGDDLVSAQRVRLNEMIRAKLDGITLPIEETTDEEPEETTDLMDALTKSLAAMQVA